MARIVECLKGGFDSGKALLGNVEVASAFGNKS
jgi:hypothetical protein